MDPESELDRVTRDLELAKATEEYCRQQAAHANDRRLAFLDSAKRQQAKAIMLARRAQELRAR